MASKPSPPSSDQPSAAPLPTSFEDAMGELEAIVQAMDDEKVPLDTLLEQYARGRQLVNFCQTRIDDAQQRVELITAGGPGQAAQLTPFNPESPPNPNRPSQSAARSAGAGASDDDIRFS